MVANRERLKTWTRNRSVRLPGFDYREHAAYHVIVCARQGTAPFADGRLAEMTCESLVDVLDQVGAYLGAYCLMPDHLHALLSPDRSGLKLGAVVGRIKGITTNKSWEFGWSGKLWQDRFYDRIVRKSEGIGNVARYVYENPERKELVADYPHRFIDRDLV